MSLQEAMTDKISISTMPSDVNFSICCNRRAIATSGFANAYCLMSNHYHLLIETQAAAPPEGMKQINGIYTQTAIRDRLSISPNLEIPYFD